MARLLPCRTITCAPLGAMWPRSIAHPNGEPAITGQYVREYRCERCRRNTKLGQVEYNRLPELTLADFERIAREFGAPKVKDLPTKDWMAAGLKKGQAEDMFRAGLFDTNDPALTEAPLTPKDSTP